MKISKSFLRVAGVTAATLTGTLFFFIIVGVFGQEFAVAGLLLFAFSAVAIYSTFPAEGAPL